MLATNPEASSVSLKFPQYRENLTKHIGLSITHDACEVNTENWSPASGAALSSYIRDTERCVVWGTKQKARGPVSRKSAWSRNDRHGYRLRIKLGEKEKLAECQVEITSLNAGLFRYTHQGCSKSSQFLPSGKTLKLLSDKFLAALTVGKTPAETQASSVRLLETGLTRVLLPLPCSRQPQAPLPTLRTRRLPWRPPACLPGR